MQIPGTRWLINWHAAALLVAAYQLVVCGAAFAAAVSPHGRIVGYATGWDAAQDRDAGKIDTLIFAFAKLIDGRVVIGADGEQRLRQLTQLKGEHPALRVAISVGGWGAGEWCRIFPERQVIRGIPHQHDRSWRPRFATFGEILPGWSEVFAILAYPQRWKEF